MQITSTDFKQNLSRYLGVARREDVQITKNGSVIAVLTQPKPKSSWVDDIAGIIPQEVVGDKLFKSDRLAAKYENLN
ncbi:hypothetical protein FACS18949_14870 [Clostridia bacterium]|nr:hypothetical protein FACS189425_05030 [Clostridia bacterium]GHV35977.1 hypothetical protein FACS18949_14870 [Clostridia bacterium]